MNIYVHPDMRITQAKASSIPATGVSHNRGTVSLWLVVVDVNPVVLSTGAWHKGDASPSKTSSFRYELITSFHSLLTVTLEVKPNMDLTPMTRIFPEVLVNSVASQEVN